MHETRMHFVSCDWGTSMFRLRLMGQPAEREIRTEEGAARLAGADAEGNRERRFRAVLGRGLAALQAPPDWPIVISGMASSSIGWKELPYAHLPFALDGGDVVREQLDHRIHLVSGLRSATDILRGEETQAIGLAAFLGRDLPSRATFVLPGTHSKHVAVERGRICNFRTYMTGELFDLLSGQSVLRHSTEAGAALDRLALREGVEEAQRQPLTAALFRVRTRQVLDRHDPRANTSFLSGLLIGLELALLRELEGPVIIAAGGGLRSAYAAAGEALGLGARLTLVDSDPLAALGQEVVLRRILSGN